MKKFVSFVLVAMLVVTCLATVAFAAGSATAYVSSSQVVNPGQTVTLTVGVTGEFSNYELTVSADSGLTITSITGVTANPANGKVAYSGSANVTSHSFTVTVKVAEDAQIGSYNVYATPTYGSMIVPVEEDTEDGIKDGLIRVSLASGACTLTIECKHEWDEGVVTTPATCTEPGVMTYTCTKCGETETETIPANGHDVIDCSKTDWEFKDGSGHYHDHICSVCGEKVGETHKEAHTMVPYKQETLENGQIKFYRSCKCGYYDTQVVDPGTPPTGDITDMLTVSTAAIFVSMMGVVALVVKRKTV